MSNTLSPQFSLYSLVATRSDDATFFEQRGALQNISAQIERAVWQKQLATRLFAGFQKMSFFMNRAKQYQRLASVTEGIWVFGIPDVIPPMIEGITYIFLEESAALTKEWFLVVDAPDYFSALSALDVTGFDVPQVKRRFRGVWTFEDDLVHLLQVALSMAIGEQPVQVPKRMYSSHLHQISRTTTSLIGGLEKKNLQLRESKLTSDFIGVITHEMRTPLANLAFSAEILAKYGFENWPNEQKKEFKTLQKHLGQAQRMTDNLISFATFLSKQADFDLEVTDLTELITETLQLLRRSAEQKKLVFEVNIAPDIPLMLLDKSKMQDAIYHLVDNAIKFSNQGGQIRLACWCQDDQIFFEIEDEGIGIAPHELVHIWDGFIQMSDSLMRGLEGLGLGLALVKYAIEVHGGEVMAVSDGQKGSTFHFMVPVKSAKNRLT